MASSGADSAEDVGGAESVEDGRFPVTESSRGAFRTSHQATPSPVSMGSARTATDWTRVPEGSAGTRPAQPRVMRRTWRHSPYTVTVECAAIAGTAEREQLQRTRVPHLTSLPSMLFAQNRLAVHIDLVATPYTWVLSFDALDALALVSGERPSDLTVREARIWQEHRSAHNLSPVQSCSDWTFTAAYRGQVRMHPRDALGQEVRPAWRRLPATASASASAIPLQELQRTDMPLVAYEELVLYEDEMDDHGVARLSVKMRIAQHAYVYILVRFWLRIDEVLVRIRDTRYFHRVGSDRLVRQVQHREAAVESVQRAILAQWLAGAEESAPRSKDSRALQTALRCTDDVLVCPYVPLVESYEECWACLGSRDDDDDDDDDENGEM